MEAMDPIALWPDGPRLVPDLPMPDRAYVPGEGIHPRRSPAHIPELPPVPETWPKEGADCIPFLYGIDLYHQGYFWEAHEVWEEAWKALAPQAPERRLLQGLIFLTVACLKTRCGNSRGAKRHCRMALKRLESLEAHPFLLGIDIRHLAAGLQVLYRALDLNPVHSENLRQIAPRIEWSSAGGA